MTCTNLDWLVFQDCLDDVEDRLDYILERVLLPLSKYVLDMATALDFPETTFPDVGPLHVHNVRGQLSKVFTALESLVGVLEADVESIRAERQEVDGPIFDSTVWTAATELAVIAQEAEREAGEE